MDYHPSIDSRLVHFHPDESQHEVSFHGTEFAVTETFSAMSIDSWFQNKYIVQPAPRSFGLAVYSEDRINANFIVFTSYSTHSTLIVKLQRQNIAGLRDSLREIFILEENRFFGADMNRVAEHLVTLKVGFHFNRFFDVILGHRWRAEQPIGALFTVQAREQQIAFMAAARNWLCTDYVSCDWRPISDDLFLYMVISGLFHGMYAHAMNSFV